MMYFYSFLFFPLSPPSPSSASLLTTEGPPSPYESDPAQGFSLLSVSLLVGGFCEALRDNFDFINKLRRKK